MRLIAAEQTTRYTGSFDSFSLFRFPALYPHLVLGMDVRQPTGPGGFLPVRTWDGVRGRTGCFPRSHPDW